MTHTPNSQMADRSGKPRYESTKTTSKKNSPSNVTESEATGNEMVWKQEYKVEKIALAVTAILILIILNILSFLVTILINVLVIMAVKMRPRWSPRLQKKYNILLPCLAGTDLLVGAASQRLFQKRGVRSLKKTKKKAI